jgi:hypothetical protein
MKNSKSKVVLFEDDPKFGPQIEAAIRRHLPVSIELVTFVSKLTQKTFSDPYEDQLRKELLNRTYANTVLIVSDRDLSKTKNYTGLSEAIVSKVAAELGVPICLYARGTTDDVLERQKMWGDGRIVLDSEDSEAMAIKIHTLVDGFQQISKKLPGILKLKGKKKLLTPSAVMASLLKHPEFTDKIALYGSGDQKMVAEILPFTVEKKVKQLKKRLPCLLGYWLFDSIFRFPGLLVDSVAAASYLNIEVETFVKNGKVKNLFKSALYDGPFADASDPHWWRAKLDDILGAGNSKDGLSYIQRKLKQNFEFCRCTVNSKIPAGYYCVATKKPVSAENSKGNISWFPPGADLARIRNDVFEEIGPWLGLY